MAASLQVVSCHQIPLFLKELVLNIHSTPSNKITVPVLCILVVYKIKLSSMPREGPQRFFPACRAHFHPQFQLPIFYFSLQVKWCHRPPQCEMPKGDNTHLEHKPDTWFGKNTILNRPEVKVPPDQKQAILVISTTNSCSWEKRFWTPAIDLGLMLNLSFDSYGREKEVVAGEECLNFWLFYLLLKYRGTY